MLITQVLGVEIAQNVMKSQYNDRNHKELKKCKMIQLKADASLLIFICPCCCFMFTRPLIIQKTLSDAGCVLWLDIDQRFITGDLEPYLTRAKSSGVQAWLMEDRVPTSSRTHQKMFRKFGIADAEDYNFQVRTNPWIAWRLSSRRWCWIVL